MVSPELIRRYSFLGLSVEQVDILANASEELEVEPGYYF